MGELGPEHEVLVGVGHVRPLVVTGNRPDLPRVPAVGVQPLGVTPGGLIRGLLLARSGIEPNLWPAVTIEE